MAGAGRKRGRRIAAVFALPGLLLAACQTGGPSEPAVLAQADPVTIETLKSALAEALGRQPIRLGPGDLTARSSLTVLPPPLGPYETASPAEPTDFSLQLSGNACYLVNDDTGERIRLNNVTCRPAP